MERMRRSENICNMDTSSLRAFPYPLMMTLTANSLPLFNSVALWTSDIPPSPIFLPILYSFDKHLKTSSSSIFFLKNKTRDSAVPNHGKQKKNKTPNLDLPRLV
eukprot:Lithocolla_globosa_v1_NODE_2427_length_2012_cov_6.718447.p2 type:complete len:104 gc:universal NODE_2427_length_2012_cov_6.718447:400-89(-)